MIFDIPEKFFAYENEKTIQRIAKSLFKHSPVCFTDHARIFYDGTWIFFTSAVEVSDYFFKNDFAFLPYVNIEKAKSFILLNTVKKFRPSLQVARASLAIDHLLAYSVVNIKQAFIDIFWFGAYANEKNVINFYLNNLEFLANYANYYIAEARHLINLAKEKRILVPVSLKEDYNQKFLCLKNMFPFGNPMGKVCGILNKLSPKEYECLHFLLNGYTAKMSAKQLDISPRTVETHIQNIKLKLKCRTRNELIIKLKNVGYFAVQ